MFCGCRYDDVNTAVETNLRKQAEVLHGIDANMHAFGDILQQSTSTQQVNPTVIMDTNTGLVQ